MILTWKVFNLSLKIFCTSTVDNCQIINYQLSIINSIVCTFFEGHYHKGVAVLVNSLSVSGYEGVIWVGYKGELPHWATGLKTENEVEIMRVTDRLFLHFLKFPSDAFLPFCKPSFLLNLLDKYQPSGEQIFYFDCDIVIKCPFSYFEKWVSYGVALCEDMNSPLSPTHPLRYQWVEYFKKYNIVVRQTDNQYVNGGFIALKRSKKGFLELWENVQNAMLDDVKEVKTVGLKDRTYLFNRTDQDALNVAKDATTETLSIADGDAMDFRGFGYIMSHAAGPRKPWENNWLMHVLKNGQSPAMTDRLFLQHTQYPLSIYTKKQLFFKKMHLKIAVVLARILT